MHVRFLNILPVDISHAPLLLEQHLHYNGACGCLVKCLKYFVNSKISNPTGASVKLNYVYAEY